MGATYDIINANPIKFEYQGNGMYIMNNEWPGSASGYLSYSSGAYDECSYDHPAHSLRPAYGKSSAMTVSLAIMQASNLAVPIMTSAHPAWNGLQIVFPAFLSGAVLTSLVVFGR